MFPETRNDDRLLWVEYCKKFYPQTVMKGNKTGRYAVYLEDVVKKLPQQASLKRYRAEYQNEMKILLPTRWEVAKQRGIAEEIWRAEMGARKDPPAVNYLPYRN